MTHKFVPDEQQSIVKVIGMRANYLVDVEPVGGK